jgi:hypothetical protein
MARQLSMIIDGSKHLERASEYLYAMKRPSKKEIREAVEKLKDKKEGSTEVEQTTAKTHEKGFNSQRIRKKGV